ncbi:hypothetical protein SASPL_132876 [Salvia splendens]|uniref:Uncharacterized protein n=1 Tax=Salvia splendens TaxID=180675 RepID=A0A8X8X324_SALSN|nr:hypothetical protein SASPL_132876 [Salvia splendens]
MDAVIKGDLEAGKPVGGYEIGKEGLKHLQVLSTRKHGLVRAVNLDKMAFVALPCGIGILDGVLRFWL